ncbi:unnamed protein product [Protopolystoma xenopodis]|uniref:Uncharacterized protein n=1 Tax=Protopolystoma xenopodis TaxID=117903 RepID=A0A448XJI9_9PLAT|nr:unnamed protein product [Protopolystoma xenopodis]
MGDGHRHDAQGRPVIGPQTEPSPTSPLSPSVCATTDKYIRRIIHFAPFYDTLKISEPGPARFCWQKTARTRLPQLAPSTDTMFDLGSAKIIQSHCSTPGHIHTEHLKIMGAVMFTGRAHLVAHVWRGHRRCSGGGCDAGVNVGVGTGADTRAALAIASALLRYHISDYTTRPSPHPIRPDPIRPDLTWPVTGVGSCRGFAKDCVEVVAEASGTKGSGVECVGDDDGKKLFVYTTTPFEAIGCSRPRAKLTQMDQHNPTSFRIISFSPNGVQFRPRGRNPMRLERELR